MTSEVTVMIGRTLAHYKIIEKIGAGGMGEVYRASDSKLGRDVALKMLPPEAAGDLKRVQRLMREARAVASLNHPHIVTVYSIEETDGLHFLTMEYVQGRPLSEAIPSKGMAIERLLELACPLAEALAAAHAVGVVHRDLKPANVVLGKDRRPKILDFGLAKFLDQGGASGMEQTAPVSLLSKEGVVMGTAPYMSPEQLQGQTVDARSDVYSFGVLLFELATGRRPFTAKSQAALFSSILNDPPPSVVALRDDLPASLQRVIARCLEKDPLRRFQTSQDVSNEFAALRAEVSSGSGPSASGREPSPGKRLLPSLLKRMAAGLAVVLLAGAGAVQVRSGCAPSTAQASVAVLPFTNTSEDPELEYLSDGVTESLISRLSEISGLKVMSRHSVSRFKDGDLDANSVGRQLGVASLLMGHVDSRGDRLVVGVELLDVKDGSQIWGDRFDRAKTDILTIERDIVTRISEKLKVRLSGDEVARLARIDSLDPEAYSLYLKGRHFQVGASVDKSERAEELFRQALEIEPRFALAYAGLGDTYVNQAWLNSRTREEMLPKAKSALAKALEVDPDLCEARVLEGRVKAYFDWDWSGAEAAFRRAIELKPGSDIAHRRYSSFLCIVNRMDDALHESRHARALDPLSSYAAHTHAFNLMIARRYDEAAAEFHNAIHLNPNWIWGNIKLAMTLALMGDHAGAEAAKSRAEELLGERPGSQLAQAWLARIEALAGKPSRARETLDRFLEESRQGYVDPWSLATLYISLGEDQLTLETLEQGCEMRSPSMVYLLISKDGMFTAIGDDPRFHDLLRRMGFLDIPS